MSETKQIDEVSFEEVQESVGRAIEESNGFTNLSDEEVEAGILEMVELDRRMSAEGR